MKFEFNQGVPDECIEWLWDNVGPGNLVPGKYKDASLDHYSWFYKRVTHEIPCHDPKHDPYSRYVPTIFIEDEKKAILFALRWQ